MSTINLCGRKGGCCPKLVINRGKEELSFTIVDDEESVNLSVEEARNLALVILKEVKK